jgi:hypothetical protein
MGGGSRIFITDADGANIREFSHGEGLPIAINDSGQIAGQVGAGRNTAFVSAANGGPITQLGTCSIAYDRSGASAINKFGVVIGRCGSDTWPRGPAAVTIKGSFVELQSLVDDAVGWSRFSATAINDDGEIVGTAVKGNDTHGVILRPRRNTASSSP